MKESTKSSRQIPVHEAQTAMRRAAHSAGLVHISEVLADMMPTLAARAFSRGCEDMGEVGKARPAAFTEQIGETPAT
jgi:hypothetical protein